MKTGQFQRNENRSRLRVLPAGCHAARLDMKDNGEPGDRPQAGKIKLMIIDARSMADSKRYRYLHRRWRCGGHCLAHESRWRRTSAVCLLERVVWSRTGRHNRLYWVRIRRSLLPDGYFAGPGSSAGPAIAGTSPSAIMCSGVRLKPLDPIEFRGTGIGALYGWPFGKQHLAPFYERAERFCRIGTVHRTHPDDPAQPELPLLNGG